MLKAVKKLVPIVGILLVVGIFAYSFVKGMYSPVTKVGFACGSEVRITTFGTKNGEEKAILALNEITRLDNELLSDTIPSSAVYKLNEAGEYTDLNGEFIKYINECISYTEKCPQMTLLSKPFISAWDIGGEGRVPTDEEIALTVKKADMANLIISENKITLNNDSLLSFGAFGKGTVCEAGINSLKQNGVKSAIVTVGGTVGVFGSPEKNKPFEIGVRNPFLSANEYFATINVTDCFISTSGDYEKYFEKDSVRYCHIFDATTGRPVNSDITSVTVITDSGTKSDFLSTAIFILGEDGINLANEMNAQVIIVKKDKSVIISKSLKEKFNLVDNSFTVSEI